MPRNLQEFSAISKAIHLSYEILQTDQSSSQEALDRLKDAEMSLSKALDFRLTQNGRMKYT